MPSKNPRIEYSVGSFLEFTNRAATKQITYYLILGVLIGPTGSDQNTHRSILNRFDPFRPAFKRTKELLVQSNPSLDHPPFFFYILFL